MLVSFINALPLQYFRHRSMISSKILVYSCINSAFLFSYNHNKFFAVKFIVVFRSTYQTSLESSYAFSFLNPRVIIFIKIIKPSLRNIMQLVYPILGKIKS